jgi:Ca2+-transporting ATPase
VTHWHALPPDDVLHRLASTPAGLTSAAAAERLARHGPNTLPPPRPFPWWRILLEQLRGTVPLLLLGAAAIAAASGDGLDATAIATVLALNVAIGFGTELPARRAIEALQALTAPRATVVRDGHARETDARDLVPGDVVILEAGMTVPADVRLLDSAELRAVEATLTGEPVPAAKHAGAAVTADAPLAERPTIAHHGTTIVAGHGRGVVVATGGATELGRIGRLVSGVAPTRTPLEQRLDRLGRRLAVAALVVAALVGVLQRLHGHAWHDVLQLAIALAVAAVPEGLPAVATITLALGVRRMARRRALVRRLPVVETLGSATVICTDKTGTLTTGEMTATRLWTPAAGDGDWHVTGAGYAPEGGVFRDGTRGDASASPALAALIRAAALATRAELHRRDGAWHATGDPTDVAMLALARKAGLDPTRGAAADEVGCVPFASERGYLATMHAEPAGTVASVKGAPVRVLERCATVATPDGERPLDDAARGAVLARNHAFGAHGLRVLAVATGPVTGTSDAHVRGLRLLGLVGLSDPPAPGVDETIRRFREAGLRTVLVTGDQHRTAVTIGRALGLVTTDDGELEGRTLERLDDAALTAAAARATIVSRVSPEAKLRLVRALRHSGEVVAMLGDGVNDAAALRQADIGVAMGRRGSDVARQAAGVVLQDDRFATIGAAVEEGRVIADNIRKFVFYLFSCNLAEILVFLGAALLGWAAPLLPLQILWLNLVTDTFPALALAVEPAEPDVMRRPPQPARAPILSAAATRAVIGYAAVIAAVALAAAWWAGGAAAGPAGRAATLAFLTLSVAQILHLGNARSPTRVAAPGRAFSNRVAVAAAAVALALTAATVTWPALAGVLAVTSIRPLDWLVALGLGAVPALAGQALKRRS